MTDRHKQNPSWWDYQDIKRIGWVMLIFLLLIMFSHTRPGQILQSQEQVYLSMYLPVSKKTDLKSAQITHMDGTPVKVTLTAFEYNPLGTTGGYTDTVRGEIYLNYRTPDNATPTIRHSTLIHELFHSADGYHNYQKYCKTPLGKECAENKAYDFEHLFKQMINLEDKGWMVIDRKAI